MSTSSKGRRYQLIFDQFTKSQQQQLFTNSANFVFCPDAEFLDVIGTKKLKIFPPGYSH
jgi:hypothetical protein